MCAYMSGHTAHTECSTSTQVESCESKLHGCLAVTRPFDTIGAEMCNHIMSASGAGNVTSHCTNTYMCTSCAIGLGWK